MYRAPVTLYTSLYSVAQHRMDQGLNGGSGHVILHWDLVESTVSNSSPIRAEKRGRL